MSQGSHVMGGEAISHARSSPGTILREGGAGDEPGEPRDGRGSHFPHGSTPRTILMGGSAGDTA